VRPAKSSSVSIAVAGEQGDGGGEAVQEVRAADRSDLARAEHAGQRGAVQGGGDDAGVVVGLAEQVGAAAVAGEQEGGGGGAAVEHVAEVLVGGGRVAHLVLGGGADLDDVADLDGAGVGVPAHDGADEEVAAAKVELVLVNDPAELDAAVEEL